MKKTTQDAMSQELTAAKEALDTSDESPSYHLQRRRTEDEMRHALALLLSGHARPRDDESPRILEDAINEVFALRQINMDLMQTVSTAYQNGIAAIRALTAR